MAQSEFLDDNLQDVMEQWRYYFSVLSPQSGNSIIDVGCGSGNAPRYLLNLYPGVGKVTGVEYSDNRFERAASAWESSGKPSQLEFIRADAQALPFEDSSFDRAICVDTLEWVQEPVMAIREIRRVLRPGGTAVIIHSDFDAQVFSSTERELTRKIVHAFSDSGPNGQLGRQLYSLCVESGFVHVEPQVYPLINTSWQPDLYGYRAAHMAVEWLTEKSLVSDADLTRWLADLEQQAVEGRFFYSINRNICKCVK